MNFVDIKNDVAFRKIFAKENRKEVLISFLNAVLLLQANYKIVDVNILTPYQLNRCNTGTNYVGRIIYQKQNIFF